MVDAALLVVKAGATPYALVQRASDLIGRDRIIGVVLNGAQDPLHRRGYEYYEHYYRHTGGEVE
jgi:Mrp family chromosome partitioning ATPase